MARTDTLGNFLTDVADAIRTKEGTSDPIQASTFDTRIANLPSGGGGSIILMGARHIVLDSANSITIEAPTSIAQGLNSSKYNTTETDYSRWAQTGFKAYTNNSGTHKGLIFVFVRSDYTLSNELELIAETEWFTSADNIRQKLLVCWCEGDTGTITVQNTGRLEATYVEFGNIAKSTSQDVILNTTVNAGSNNYTVTAPSKMCIFAQSAVYNITDNLGSAYYNQNYINSVLGIRLFVEISTTSGTKNVMVSESSPAGVIGIEINAG